MEKQHAVCFSQENQWPLHCWIHGDVSDLIPLDQSAAFSPVDHFVLWNTLLTVSMIPHLFGPCPSPYNLSDHSFSVSYWSFSISLSTKCWGVSGLSPWTLLFSIYIYFLYDLIHLRGFKFHLIANDSEIYISSQDLPLASKTIYPTAYLTSAFGGLKGTLIQLSSLQTSYSYTLPVSVNGKSIFQFIGLNTVVEFFTPVFLSGPSFSPSENPVSFTLKIYWIQLLFIAPIATTLVQTTSLSWITLIPS